MLYTKVHWVHTEISHIIENLNYVYVLGAQDPISEILIPDLGMPVSQCWETGI